MPKAISSQKTLARRFHLQGIDSANLQPITIHSSSLVQNVEPQKQKLVSPPPALVLPFPPQINPEDLMNCKTRKLPSKPPNAFFIYRKVYTKALVAQNLRFKMTDVSPWVSISWKRESTEVKDKYKAIAKEVRQLYKQLKLNSGQAVDNSSSSSSSSSTCDSSPSSGSSSPPLSDNQYLSSLFWIMPTDSGFFQLSDSSEFPTSPEYFSLWQDDNNTFHGECPSMITTMYENVNTDLSYESYEFIDLDYSQYLNEQFDVEQPLIQTSFE
ncbi:10331_t:CDS:1 [Dentiscutata erythropus]|uniref:10331_t:CDS:1 n=1 Tax=Dentiscutata erythropus TaxID=1348616 RepID=A0A9N8Z341_9GLOM|nr:10331_t:CDS:1 [Dentiscutata erythropus]